jgi:hypothetical protein
LIHIPRLIEKGKPDLMVHVYNPSIQRVGEDWGFETSRVYIVRPFLKKKKKKKKEGEKANEYPGGECILQFIKL